MYELSDHPLEFPFRRPIEKTNQFTCDPDNVLLLIACEKTKSYGKCPNERHTQESDMLFLNPNKPIATCSSESCEGCEVSRSLHCHFSIKDLIHFMAMCVPSLLLGGWGIANVGAWFLVPWIVFMCGYFWFLEIRVMCSHCPHYAEPGSSLKCWANYGAPKIWGYRPGPMNSLEKCLFLGGFAVIWGYPLYFLITGVQWFLLLVYALSTIGCAMTLKLFLCTQCMNFACPLNGVDDATRRAFFKKNPQVAKAWGQNSPGRAFL